MLVGAAEATHHAIRGFQLASDPRPSRGGGAAGVVLGKLGLLEDGLEFLQKTRLARRQDGDQSAEQAFSGAGALFQFSKVDAIG